ncbi:trans-sialidase [Trypanosoma cruzi Dm28c]|uniref:Trans-sialidase n=1 Tax=Trypanosoma cruzi Dm28c TaxID=1416333 RepID=V5B3P1_TRYCR|nr:trans-sialidase [Trypanosoma cruzi Dm28c]
MLYNEKLLERDLYELNASKVTIPSLGVEENATGQVTSKEVSVASQSNSVESTSHEEFTEDDPEKRGENSVDGVVPAASSSTVAAGLSVPEPAAASESAGNSRSEDSAQPSEDKTSQQATMNEGNKSMQQDSDVQTQELKSAELTGVTDLERSSKSYGTQQPEGEGEASGRSSGSVSSVAASLNMDTVAAPAGGEHQVQQSIELSAENNEVRSTGTGTTDAEESLILEAGDRSSERTMNSDSSLTPSKSDAEPTSAEDTDDVSRTDGAEVSFEDSKQVPQTVDTAPANTSTTPGETKIPSESNATTPSDTGILLEKGQPGELSGMVLFAESTVHGCVSRVFLLLLGLWGIAALC